MSWYDLHKQPDTMFGPSSISNGCLFHGPYRDVDADVQTILIKRALVIDGMAALVARYKSLQDIFVRINQGARKDSIARINMKSLTLKGYSRYLARGGVKVSQNGRLKSDPRVHLSAYSDPYSRGFSQYQIEMFMMEWVEIEPLTDLEYEFDGRKSVLANYNDIASLEFLPDYNGPTVFKFTRTVKTPEEKATINDDYCFAPLDMFGHTVALGDLLVYARADELIIGKLLKVGKSGFLTVQTIMDKREVRLQGKASVQAIKRGQKVKALMRFDKDDNLSQKLMMEKLRK